MPCGYWAAFIISAVLIRPWGVLRLLWLRISLTMFGLFLNCSGFVLYRHLRHLPFNVELPHPQVELVYQLTCDFTR